MYHQLSEHMQLQKALFDMRRDLSVQEIVKRRIRTIDIFVALASQQEIQPHN